MVEVPEEFNKAIYEMTEGNPGALTAVMAMIQLDFFKSASACATLRAFNITGQHIWIAYKDICKEDPQALMDALLAPGIHDAPGEGIAEDLESLPYGYESPLGKGRKKK